MIDTFPPSTQSRLNSSPPPSRPLKRRIFLETPPPPVSKTNATKLYLSTPDLESTPDSESAKGHPELLLGRRLNFSDATSVSSQQKLSMVRLKHMIPVLLFLAAGVPFIVHLKLGSEMHPLDQQKLKLDDSRLIRKDGTSKTEEVPKSLDNNEEVDVLPFERDHFLRFKSSNDKRLMKFHSVHERGTIKSSWKQFTLSPTEIIKIDRITVSLTGSISQTENNVIAFDPQDENRSNVNDTSSKDEKQLLTSETAAWEAGQECVPMEDWQTTFKPTCNSLHEMDMPFLLNKEAYSLVSNKGFWRNAWNVDMTIAENGMSPVNNIVIKSLKYYHEPNDETFELNRVDGVAMEQLTHSRYVTDIYGYCGSTSLQEFAGGNLAKFLPKLKPVEKLGMAAWIANGVADIHEVGKKAGGNKVAGNNTTAASLIHNDINMDNILLGDRDGVRVPLINDFNIAIFRKKDSLTGAPCKFRGRFFNPQWMAPEQMFTKDREDGLSIGYLDEKIDVYALGNILYKIAVGNSPWKYNFNKAKKILEEHKEKITKTKLKGGKPKVPDDVKNSTDLSIQAVLTAMDRCYRNDPDVRPSAREISEYLNKKFLATAKK